MGEKSGRDRWLSLSKVGDALLLGIGCLAWLVTILLMVLLFWP